MENSIVIIVGKQGIELLEKASNEILERCKTVIDDIPPEPPIVVNNIIKRTTLDTKDKHKGHERPYKYHK